MLLLRYAIKVSVLEPCKTFSIASISTGTIRPRSFPNVTFMWTSCFQSTVHSANSVKNAVHFGSVARRRTADSIIAINQATEQSEVKKMMSAMEQPAAKLYNIDPSLADLYLQVNLVGANEMNCIAVCKVGKN